MEFIIKTDFIPDVEGAKKAGFPELIRCKDCQHKEKDGISEGYHYCNVNGLAVKDDFFCASAERKGGDGDG